MPVGNAVAFSQCTPIEEQAIPFIFFGDNLRSNILSLSIDIDIIEAQVLIEQWRREYNQVRPHSSLSYRPPAPETRIPVTLT